VAERLLFAAGVLSEPGSVDAGSAQTDKAMSSTGADFRHLTPLVLMTALQRAGTAVCLHAFVLEAPRDAQGALLGLLAQLDAVPVETGYDATAVTLTGHVPARCTSSGSGCRG
jgi:hypothetical protein